MKNSTVLLITGDDTASQPITDHLIEVGHDVTVVNNGADALEHISAHGLPHIVLIDLILPNMHGFELSERLRSMADVPIIFLASTYDTDTIVKGLQLYAEDFIVRPIDPRELVARINVVLARMPGLDYARSPVIDVDGHLHVDFAHNRIMIDGESIALTPIESLLLHVLLRNAGHVVENRILIARVWPGQNIFEDTLRVHMHRLRRKLEQDSHRPRYIRTERGKGYTFTVTPGQHGLS
jgi:DNA-binding response OmpR family regulator